VAADRPLPAGGHVASLVTAFAAGLVEKVARIVRGSPGRAAQHALADQALAKAGLLRPVLVALGDADDRAYEHLMQVRRDGDEAAKAAARVDAARTQFDLVEHAATVAHVAASLEARVGPALRADLVTARLLAVAAAQGAYGNVTANLGAMGGTEADRMRREAEAVVDGLP
jgi:formiminotetrahydrofolate cyclodeaminase